MREGPATTWGEVSDAWLVGRARELKVVGQHSDAHGQRTTIHQADELLAEARHRGQPRVIAQVLCCCATLRLTAAELLDDAQPLLDELLTHTHKHGLHVLRADARALRGRLALAEGNEDSALTEAAESLVILDDDLVPDAAMGRRSWERLLATSLIDVGLLLTQLGIYDLADNVMARALHRIRESGGPHEIATHMINRCRMLVGWGLRLERIGKYDDAAGRFTTASQIASAVDTPWKESLFPRVAGKTAAEQMPVLGAAQALADPGPGYIDRLETLRTLERAIHPREKILVAVALSRCLVRSERGCEAAAVLSAARDDLAEDVSEPTLRISLAREYAHVSELADVSATEAVREYALALEDELWTMRESRSSSLLARLEKHRMNREHHAITRQALRDPLTGLPNRRALDSRLDSLLAHPESQPLSVALVDLDGFKEVNDRSSHAEGDEVLRVIARTLSDTLRADDLVSRYGGDEFVVLLPGVTLSASESALKRTVEAVARLPRSLSRGVTLSIGVVSMRLQESSSQVLARADSAMYQSKRHGGNRVTALTADPASPYPNSGPAWTPPDAT